MRFDRTVTSSFAPPATALEVLYVGLERNESDARTLDRELTELLDRLASVRVQMAANKAIRASIVSGCQTLEALVQPEVTS